MLIDRAVAVFTSFWRHRHLILQLARRDVVGRYRGSLLGLTWSLLNPLLMLGVYSFLFGVIFRSRWEGGGAEGPWQYALVLFIGLIIHGLFAECVNRAPTLVLQHPSYVKRVVFPLEILPWTVLVSALFHAAVSFGVWFAAAASSGLWPSLSALWLPVVLAPLLLLSIGLGWGLASLGVYLRDLGQTVALFTSVLLFLSPILYPITMVPAEFRVLLHLNPLTFPVEQARAVLALHRPPDFGGLALNTVQNLVIAAVGLWWFERTRKGFADVV